MDADQNPPRRRILIVDDDLKLRELLKSYLESNGYEVFLLPDGRDVEDVLSTQVPDLVILDIMLPGEDGTSICRRLRSQEYKSPIIMLTGRGDEVDRIVGLELGADDYMGKPFNPRELLARIKAVLRRTDSSGLGRGQLLRFGECILDHERREVRRNGEVVPLTNGDFQLLAALAKRPGQPMNRDELLDRTRGREYDAVDRTIDVQISKLRRALEADPATPRYIKTVWGYGYVFVQDPEP